MCGRASTSRSRWTSRTKIVPGLGSRRWRSSFSPMRLSKISASRCNPLEDGNRRLSGHRDCFHAVGEILGEPVRYVDHRERALDDVELVVLPGGFSYGDYLRCGAIARFAP